MTSTQDPSGEPGDVSPAAADSDAATGTDGGSGRRRSGPGGRPSRARRSARPRASRPGTAPSTAATGLARRSGRGVSGPIASPRRTLLPKSRLTRQITALGLVLCAVALSLAFPLRGLLEQKQALAAAQETQQSLEQQKTELLGRREALLDPDYVAAEARRRLQYVKPGDTVFVVHAPDVAPTDAAAAAAAVPAGPWYGDLWSTLSDQS